MLFNEKMQNLILNHRHVMLAKFSQKNSSTPKNGAQRVSGGITEFEGTMLQ